jgi:hypothetical protein
MAKVTRSTSSSENSSALQKRTAQTDSKETAADLFTKESLRNPRFKELPLSGKTFAIVGARPPTK